MTFSFHRFAWAGLLAGAALTTMGGRAAACGGFFCNSAQGVNQSAERIIFADNGDGTITAVIQIMYQGSAQDFSWLLPISTVPQENDLGVASDLAFTRLQNATNPQYTLATQVEGICGTPSGETCSNNPFLAGCAARVPAPAAQPATSAPGGGVSVEASGAVGPFEWTVISVDSSIADPAAPALEWLAQNGYDAQPGAGDLLGPYLASGLHLLALRLTKDADTGSIRPIKITYSAEAPMIPIKLTAVAANENMGVMTFALSKTRAVPFNYNALELNEARINWFSASSNYNDVVTQAAHEAGGQGFVTEFASSTKQLASQIWTPFDDANWQSIQNRVYGSFDELFDALYGSYQGYSGFWDAVRAAVTLPANVTFADFKLCPNCYLAESTFSPSALLSAMDTNVIEPIRGVQDLIDRSAYMTRLYSTLSAADMTVDPVFVFNPDLPDVSNVHRATRIIECSANVYQSDAPWRIEFPQGSVVRGTAATVGRWPNVSDQPANLRILTLAKSGTGRVLADNADTINADLAAYNATIPAPTSTPQPQSSDTGSQNGDPSTPATDTGSLAADMNSPGTDMSPADIPMGTASHNVGHGSCNLGAGPGESAPSVPLALGLVGLIGAAYRRRAGTESSPAKGLWTSCI